MINLDLHQIRYNNMDGPVQHTPNTNRNTPLPTPVDTRPMPFTGPSPPHVYSEHPNTSFAFLVHSQDTIPNNLPPNVDNKPLARQRRRRTSPEDQAILEEEFQKDSKPDKNARKRIVERVALGEKEVQIWFQNRRQNCRRKARPLLPHEIMSHLEANRGRSDPTSSSPSHGQQSSDLGYTPEKTTIPDAPMLGFDSSVPRSQGPHLQESSSIITTSPISMNFSETSPVDRGVGLGILLPEPRNVADESRLPTPPAVRPQTVRSISSTTRPLSVADLITPQPKATSPSPAPPARTDTINSVVTSVSADSIQEESKPTLKRSRSVLRLSLTSDGAAKISTSEESSPSPPRSQPVSNPPANTLRRSYSTTGLSDAANSPRISEPNFSLRRVPSGRSRDSRAWEFWCDNDSRNELQKIADQERTGSAADAISLMRSSSRGPLTPNMNKANAAIARYPSAKRAKTDSLFHPKPSLGRTQSSVARLQGTILPPLRMFEDNVAADGEKPTAGSEAITSANSDSDKENWEPNAENPIEHRRRMLQARGPLAASPRPVLRESMTFSGRSSNLSALLNNTNEDKKLPRGLRGSGEAKNEKENVNPEEDPEIAKFMGSKGRPKASPSKYAGEDMDCIQGLLSLSQGAWR